ncbi:MAG: DUF4178 domain-containing protein [Cyanothece sp. SIO2G6]|nr:DUF4178 domain-containing protein [Cyanothece sp. SIO2G6]
MFLIFLILIVVIVVLAVILLTQQGQSASVPAKPPSSPAERTLFDLQLGDIVQHEGTDWVVEGQLTYDEAGFQWYEYLLQDGDRRRWLAVEEDDWVDVQLLEPLTSLDISANPPQELTVNDRVYRLVGSGTARMTRKGRLDRPNAETCRFYDYDGPDNKVLSVEDWNGDIEVSVGDRINPQSLTILPGDGQSVYR